MFKKIKYIILVSIILILGISIKSQATIKVNSENISIYRLDSYYKDKYNITMPSTCKESFQLKVMDATHTPTFQIVDGYDIIDIDEEGNIKPHEYGDNYYKYGCTKIRVNVNNETTYVNVNFINYIDVYVENLIDEFIKNNIKDNMTEKEKITEVAKYIAENYSYEYIANSTTMVLEKGGDCWATSSLIRKICNKMNIFAHIRYAGDSHRNVTAYADGKYYIIEASYDMPIPRRYIITEEPNGFEYELKSDGTYKITQYDGKEKEVIIPSTYNGRKITEIGERCFNYSHSMGGLVYTKITLPDTITKICDKAFADCKELTEINIPENVSEIGSGAFSRCEDLKLKISPSNQYYTLENGILYDKNKTEIIICFNKNLGNFTVPDTVKTIRKEAFYRTNFESLNLGNGVETIERDAFFQCEGINGIKIPKSAKNLNISTFYCCGLNSVVIEDGCECDLMDLGFGSDFDNIIIPSSITSIDESAFKFCSKELIIFGDEGSYAETFAKEHNINFANRNSKPIQLTPNMVDIGSKYLYYNEKEQKPDVQVFFGETKLRENIDYTVIYPSDMKNSGTKTITVTGKENYTGILKIEYEIDFGRYPAVDFTCNDFTYGEKIEPVVTYNPTIAKPIFRYKNITNPINSYSTEQPTAVGEYYILGGVFNYNYSNLYTKRTFKILPANIDSSKFSFSNISDQTYTGNELKPNIVINYNGKELLEGTDYTITYNNNINIGKGTLNITGKGNYTGTTSKDFNIVQPIDNKNNSSDSDTNNKETSSEYSNKEKSDNIVKADSKATSENTIIVKKTTGLTNKTQDQKSITIKWNKISDGTGYELEKYDTSKKKYIKVKELTGTSYKVTGLKVATTYKFRVRAYKIIDGRKHYGNYSDVVKLTTKTKIPSISKLTAGKKKVTVKYKKVSGASGYQIQYSTNSKFKKGNKSTNTTKLSKTVKSLKSKKKYYVRIRTYRVVNGKKIYSSWSKVKNIKAK